MFQKKLLPPIHWYEGMFLQPHHFQQYAEYAEAAFSYKSQLLSPFLWGVERLAVDLDAVARGRFVVTSLDGLLRDGLVLRGEHLAVPLERNLEPFQERLQDGQALIVHLAVPEPMPKSIEVGEGEDVGHPLRWRVQPPENVVDHTTGTNPAPVTFLKLKARLLIGDEDPSGYQTLPLADIVWDNGVVKLGDFLPPTLLVLPDSPIADLVRKLCQAIRAKAAEAAGSFDAAVRHRERDPRLEGRLRAFGLVSSLLPLEQMVELGAFRPLDVYMALCRVLGELSTLRHELEIPGAAPAYNHLDLRRSFRELAGRIESLLVEGVDNYERLEIDGSDGKFTVKNLKPAQLDRAIYVALRGGARSEPEALMRWFENNCVIANADQVRDFIRFRILGIERKVTNPPPIDLQLERGTVLYQLQLSDESKQALKQNTQLFLVRAGDDPPGHERPRAIEIFVRKAAK